MATFSFGAQNQPSPFGGFGASTSTTSTPSFSASPFGTASTGTPQGFGFGTTTTSAPSLFGTPSAGFSASTTTTTSLFPTLGQPTTTSAPSTGFSFGGFGASTTSINFGSSLTAGGSTVTSAPATIGLGGVDLQASSINAPDISGRKDKAVKETFIPNELVAAVDAFKKYVKEQKAIREEMSRVSSKNILKVQSQVAALKQQLAIVSNGLQRNSVSITKLKQDSSEELRNAEIIQRTKDTPPALQYENTAPMTYFHNLAISFENQMQAYRKQIEQLERHLVSLSQPSTMTPNELTLVMRRLHDAFVTLAAQLQTVHQQIQYQKEQFLALQKTSQVDMSSIFQSRKENSKDLTLTTGFPALPLTVGPSPVSSSQSPAVLAIARARSRTQQIQGANAALGMGITGIGSGLTGSGLLGGSQSFGGSFGLQSASTFKPLGK